MYLEAVFRFYVLLNHFVGHFFFGLVRFGSFSNTIYRNLALALSKLHINVDITVGFFVGQKNYRLHMNRSGKHIHQLHSFHLIPFLLKNLQIPCEGSRFAGNINNLRCAKCNNLPNRLRVNPIPGWVYNNQVGSFLKLIHHFQHISCEEGTVFEMITLCIFICSYNRFFNQFNPYHLFRTCFSHNLPNRTCATVQVENRLIRHISGKFLYNGIKLFRAGGIRLEEGIHRNLKFQIKQLFHKEISAIEQAHFVAFDHIRQSIIHRMQNTTDRAVQFQSEQHILKFLHGKGNLRGSHQID